MHYLAMAVDLNNDGIDEYIFKQQSKTPHKTGLTPHFIFALNAREPILLGKFPAKNIRIMTKKDYGIHEIMVYNKPYNDFAGDIYAWNPYAFAFQAVNK